MPDASTNIATQGGAVTGNVTTSGDFVGRDLYKHIHYHTGPTPAGFLYVGVPSLPHHFLGRDELVEDLVNRLCAGETMALSAEGLPGVGKTTLAVALAHHPQILAHFRDGILWAGLGRTPDVASIQATWAEALGVDLRDLIDPYARAQRLTNAIGHRRLLLVLDDVWQWEAADQLRCSAPHVATVLTTRDGAIARRFAGPQQSVNVRVLDPQPAYDLLAALAPEACATDPAAARRLAGLVDGLPLALELLGGYLGASSQRRTHARRQQALTVLTDPATRLALASQRLGDPQHQDVTLQATIALSLADLPAAAVAALHALGAFAPKPARFDLPAALAVTGADEETLFTLADRNLLEMGEDETLGLHQTLSALARTQLPSEVTSCHRDYYLALVDEDRKDWQRIEAVYPQISFAWSQLHINDPNAIRFIDYLFTFQPHRGLLQDRLNWLALALTAAQHAKDQKAEAHILHEYGYAYESLGKKQRATTYYGQALALYRQVGDQRGESDTLNNLGLVYSDLGDKQQGLAYYEQALLLSRRMGDKSGEAITFNNLGLVYSDLGDKEQGLAYYEQALIFQRQVEQDKGGEATILNNIGQVHSDLGDKQLALIYYKQALVLHCQVGDRRGEAITRNNIGRIYSTLGDKRQALDYYEQAFALYRQVGDKWGEAITLSNIGSAYADLSDKQEALMYYEQALSLHCQVGDMEGEATTRNNIGRVYSTLNDKQQALKYYEQALILFSRLENKRSEAIILNNIGLAYDDLGDKQSALRYYEQSLSLCRQVGDKVDEASILNNIGGIHDRLYSDLNFEYTCEKKDSQVDE
jgi:tetratricopeptide (TPR) repeat protein